MHAAGVSRHALPVLLLFLLFFFALPFGRHTSGRTDHDAAARAFAVDLFVPKKTKLLNTIGNRDRIIDFNFFFRPCLVAVDGMMVAIVGAVYDEGDTKGTEIVARYIETGGENWAENVTERSADKWTIQWAMRKHFGTLMCFFMPKILTAVVRDGRIYLLAVNIARRINTFRARGLYDCYFRLGVGEVKRLVQGGRTVEWKTTEFILPNSVGQFTNQSLKAPFDNFDSSAFLTNRGEMVFVVKVETEEGKVVSTIIHSKDTSGATELELSYVGTAEDCYSPSFFAWGEKIIMIPADCAGSPRRVRESVDMGRTWENATGPFARLWDHLRDKKDFTTATIENKSVLLYTERKSLGWDFRRRNETWLWFTDGARVYDVGPICAPGDDVVSSSLLYTNGELFLLHRQGGVANNIVLTRLNHQLEKIKFVLKTWAKLDTCVLTLIPTDGLVGFLSNRLDLLGVWPDEYLFVDAWVSSGTRVPNGFRFSGVGAGAWWPVGRWYAGRRYNFSRHGLTVAATVTIHEAATRNSPLLTFGGAEASERLGLWYRKDIRWVVRLQDVQRTFPTAGEENTTYMMALVLRKDRLVAYLDGTSIGEGFLLSTYQRRSFVIENVYIGHYEHSAHIGNDVTFTNVFLYDRPLDDSELQALSKKTGAATTLTDSNGETGGVNRV